MKNLIAILFALNPILDMLSSAKKCFLQGELFMALGIGQTLALNPTVQAWNFSWNFENFTVANGMEKFEKSLDYLWKQAEVYGPKMGRGILNGLERSFSYGWKKIINNPHETKIVLTTILCVLIAQRIFRCIRSFFPGFHLEKVPPRHREEPREQPSSSHNAE